jgi:hypothetical protein
MVAAVALVIMMGLNLLALPVSLWLDAKGLPASLTGSSSGASGARCPGGCR